MRCGNTAYVLSLTTAPLWLGSHETGLPDRPRETPCLSDKGSGTGRIRRARGP